MGKLRMSAAVLLVLGCCGTRGLLAQSIWAWPMHDPIYPAASEDVKYSLHVVSRTGVANVRLYTAVFAVGGPAGYAPAGPEAKVAEWTPSGGRTSVDLEYTQVGGYAAGTVVRYRVVSTDSSGESDSHEVLFAIRPYPLAGQPAPVYYQGKSKKIDVVLIPDHDVAGSTAERKFYAHSRGMVEAVVITQPTLRMLSRHFNFWINPSKGSMSSHPPNMSNLSFAEAKAILHVADRPDYAVPYLRLFSTELQNRGTFIHELSHVVFYLADEYSGGGHEETSPHPNNWISLARAQSAAPALGKSATDASWIEHSGGHDWYKLCSGSCQMSLSGARVELYDSPCVARIEYTVQQLIASP